MKASRKKIGIAAHTEDAKVSDMAMVAQNFPVESSVAINAIDSNMLAVGGPVGETISRLEAQLSGTLTLPAQPTYVVNTAVETISRFGGVAAFLAALGGLLYYFG